MLNGSLLAADPTLANLRALAPNVEWMNGVQFYLRRDVPTAHGHVIHIDTEWALTSVSQLQFWRNLAPEHFGDSDVRGVLSVDVSDWTALGSDGRPAMQCSREEAVGETWKQLKRSINIGRQLLRDEDLHSWFLDPDIDNDPTNPGFLRNSEPLRVNLINTWALRPEATTVIPNLFPELVSRHACRYARGRRHLYGLVKISSTGQARACGQRYASRSRALGGRAEDAFPAAAGIEMLHNAFLVHDDIEDYSNSRRGVATMHRRAGVPIAVNAGDAMNARLRGL